MANFKDIHIGKLIQIKVEESEIDISRICNFFKCSIEEVKDMFQLTTMDANDILKWSKLLDYDFFRIYSHHLILYSPQKKQSNNNPNKNKSKLPEFRKRIYSKEIIDFILAMIKDGKKTKLQIIEEYGIPKTTLYKWIDKYSGYNY